MAEMIGHIDGEWRVHCVSCLPGSEACGVMYDEDVDTSAGVVGVECVACGVQLWDIDEMGGVL